MNASPTEMTLPPRTLYGLCAILCALLLAGCSDANSPAPHTLASLTVSPAGASVGVGQSQTFTAEGKDQSGNVLSGLSVTWASSDSSVATVAGGVATGVKAGTARITASSGGLTSNAVTLTVTTGGPGGAAGRVVVDKAAVLLPAVGRSAQLAAQVYDANGAPAAGAVTWTSSAPDKVSVDAAGHLTANAIGSAQIFAQAGGVRSTPTLVFVAVPAPQALLVTDAQLVSVGQPLGLAPGEAPGVGTRYEVTLRGVAAPAPGTVVLATETAPVEGKVVSARQSGTDIVVTLALAPLYELFSAYDIALSIDLSAFPLEALPARSARSMPSALWNAGSRGKAGGLAAARMADVPDELKLFKALSCVANVEGKAFDAPVNMTLDPELTLVLQDRPGYSKHALEGSAALVGTVGLNLKAEFKGSVRCDAQAQPKVPVFGMFSWIVVPAVRVGVGAQLEGELKVAEAQLAVEGKVGFKPVVGWECGGAAADCRALDDISPFSDFTPKYGMTPKTANGVQVKVSGQFYILAGLDLSLFVGKGNFGILEARLGPEQSFDLASEKEQAARTDYASSYDLKLKGVVEPGSAIKDALKKVINDAALEVKFKAEFSTPLSESPKGTLSASATRVAPGKPVDFTVQLTPSTIDYWLLSPNVTGVQLYRKRDNESEFTFWKAMSPLASGSSVAWGYRWVPEETDAGKYEFAALVNTQLPTPLLEVNPNSIQRVEVSCFSGGVAARLAGGLAAPVGSLVPTCSDRWDGTATLVMQSPPGVEGTLTFRSNITFTYDPKTSGNDTTSYIGSGSLSLTVEGFDPGCTVTLAPSTFAIANDSLKGQTRLKIIDDGTTPAHYEFTGAQAISFALTSSCRPYPVPLNDWYLPFAGGDGPFTAGQATLSGTKEWTAPGASKATSTWEFKRP